MTATGETPREQRFQRHAKERARPERKGKRKREGAGGGAKGKKSSGSRILVINAGSSSLRYALFAFPPATGTVLLKGYIDAIETGQRGRSRRQTTHAITLYKTSAGERRRSNRAQPVLKEQLQQQQTCKTPVRNHEEAIALALATLTETGALAAMSDITAVGHRVVHGGAVHAKPAKHPKQATLPAHRVTPALLRAVQQYNSFAPLHNPHNLAGIHKSLQHLPRAKHFIVFDTAFHRSIPDVAATYALPRSLAKKQGLRRYGFHGTSVAGAIREAKQLLGTMPKRAVVCHVGGGVSVTALLRGTSIDTSMGVTPLEGPPMGTRSGTVDPGLVIHLASQGVSASELLHLFSNESGLLGVSGVSADIREVLAAAKKGNKDAALSLALLEYHLAKHVSSYLPALGGLDTLIFTGGIGEHIASLRARVCERLAFLGVKLDRRKNDRHARIISTSSSRVSVLVIPADEERTIAQAVFSALSLC
ncbi:acetate/propionate family kinase [Candidatus Woesearchaeota archaeon]|nr:MAG: acetate/propionate family kinase [Candidatus Woesearchaeota archaeon]